LCLEICSPKLLLMLQVAEELNAMHCQAALAAMKESAVVGALDERYLHYALKLARCLAEFRAEGQSASGNVSSSPAFILLCLFD